MTAAEAAEWIDEFELEQVRTGHGSALVEHARSEQQAFLSELLVG